METISKTLQPYKDVVGQVASIVTIAQFFSGAFVCKDIYRKKTTKGVPSTPFIGGIVVGSLMLKHGLLLKDAAMLQVNIAAIFLNIIYTFFYYVYSEEKYDEILKPLGVGATIVAIFLGYAELEDPGNLEYRYGLIVTILMLLLLGSPLLDVKDIVAKQDASGIPFPLTFMGAIVTFLWLLYGIILQNQFMIVQNFIGCLLCITQLTLIFLYPGNPNEQGKNQKKSVKRE